MINEIVWHIANRSHPHKIICCIKQCLELTTLDVVIDRLHERGVLYQVLCAAIIDEEIEIIRQVLTKPIDYPKKKKVSVMNLLLQQKDDSEKNLIRDEDFLSLTGDCTNLDVLVTIVEDDDIYEELIRTIPAVDPHSPKAVTAAACVSLSRLQRVFVPNESSIIPSYPPMKSGCCGWLMNYYQPDEQQDPIEFGVALLLSRFPMPGTMASVMEFYTKNAIPLMYRVDYLLPKIGEDKRAKIINYLFDLNQVANSVFNYNQLTQQNEKFSTYAWNLLLTFIKRDEAYFCFKILDMFPDFLTKTFGDAIYYGALCNSFWIARHLRENHKFEPLTHKTEILDVFQGKIMHEAFLGHATFSECKMVLDLVLESISDVPHNAMLYALTHSDSSHTLNLLMDHASSMPPPSEVAEALALSSTGNSFDDVRDRGAFTIADCTSPAFYRKLFVGNNQDLIKDFKVKLVTWLSTSNIFDEFRHMCDVGTEKSIVAFRGFVQQHQKEISQNGSNNCKSIFETKTIDDAVCIGNYDTTRYFILKHYRPRNLVPPFLRQFVLSHRVFKQDKDVTTYLKMDPSLLQCDNADINAWLVKTRLASMTVTHQGICQFPCKCSDDLLSNSQCNEELCVTTRCGHVLCRKHAYLSRDKRCPVCDF